MSNRPTPTRWSSLRVAEKAQTAFRRVLPLFERAGRHAHVVHSWIDQNVARWEVSGFRQIRPKKHVGCDAVWDAAIVAHEGDRLVIDNVVFDADRKPTGYVPKPPAFLAARDGTGLAGN